MFNFYSITKEDIKGHNPNLPKISDHLQRMLTIGGSKSGKRNAYLI